MISQLEPFAFVVGVPRKRGKPPVIEHRKNLWGDCRRGEPMITVNTSAQSIWDGARTLKPFGRSPWDVQCTADTNGA